MTKEKKRKGDKQTAVEVVQHRETWKNKTVSGKGTTQK